MPLRHRTHQLEMQFEWPSADGIERNPLPTEAHQYERNACPVLIRPTRLGSTRYSKNCIDEASTVWHSQLARCDAIVQSRSTCS